MTNFIEALQDKTRSEAIKLVQETLNIRALTRLEEANPVQKVPGRFYIHDKSGNVVGNNKGYRTIRGAIQQQDMPGSPAHKAIWDEFYRHEKEHGKDHPNNGISSIELHEEDKTIVEAERPYGYHPSNPKFDLHNKETGEYLASTNWARNKAEAVSKYEEKNPHMVGKVGALKDKKYVSESAAVTYKADTDVVARSEGDIHYLHNQSAAGLESKFGLPYRYLDPDQGGGYSNTATIHGSDGSMHTIYAHGHIMRLRPVIGHATPEQTAALKKHLGVNESLDECTIAAEGDTDRVVIAEESKEG